MNPSPEGSRPASGSLLTANQVAEMLGVRVDWVWRETRAGRIPAVTLGRYRRYRRESIEAWIGHLERGMIDAGS